MSEEKVQTPEEKESKPKSKRKPVDKCPACGLSVVYRVKEGSEPPFEIPYTYRRKTVHQCKLTTAERKAGLVTRFWRSRHVSQEIRRIEGA